MTAALLLVVLLCASVLAAILAKRVNVPYPIAFVVGGILLSFIPNLPKPHVDPHLILLLVLPPLLYYGGWSTDLFEFRRNIQPITLLAIGLVAFSTIVVAAIAHASIHLDWATAFVLGAVVSPPDAVAAEAIFHRMSVPRRIVSILTGEALLNDATALVLYRFAVVAAVTGAFSLGKVLVTFPIVALGGIAIGLLAGYFVEFVLRFLSKEQLEDATISNVVLLIAPYASYLPAEALHVSGVLAVVTTGIYLNQRATYFLSSEGRVVGIAIWDTMIFLLNALVFLFIGLELPEITSSLGNSFARFLLDGLFISIAVILIRIVWVYPAVWLPRVFVKHIRIHDPLPPWQSIAVVAWSGMRGIVSLATALAIPLTDSAGRPLAARDEIIFITLCVIFVTLIFQGLTLGPMITWLGVSETANPQKRESTLRIRALEAGLRRLNELEPTFHSSAEWGAAGRLLYEYETRIEHLRGDLKEDQAEDERLASETDHRLQKELLHAERDEIARLRVNGEIPDDIFRSIAYDLDLAQLRLR